MLNAAIAVVDLHGREAVTGLMKMFEEYLGRSGGEGETADYIKEAVVIVRSPLDCVWAKLKEVAVRSTGSSP